jgi:uncharacterized protein (DUF58 family)
MIPASRAFQIAGLALLLLTVAVVAPGLAPIAIVTDVLLVLAILFDGWRAGHRTLSVARAWPPFLVQGAAATVEVRFESPVAGRIVAREALHPGLAAGPLREELDLAAGAAAIWRYEITPRRRGRPLAGPLTVRVLGPWGLAWAQRDALPAGPVRVYPQVRWEGRVGRLLVLAHRRELGLAPMRLRGIGAEPYGLKEYRVGDPPNKIHWKASARHGRLIAREETWERGRRLVIVLDCARAMASVQDERSKLDHALAAALALARVAHSRGDHIRIAAVSDRLERVVKVERGGLAGAYAALFDVQPRLTEPAFATLPESIAAIEPRRSTVVLFTSVVDLAAAEVLKEALVVLARRHRVVLLNLEDVELSRLAYGVPESLAEAYAKVSAMGIVLGNRKLGQRLSHSGVQVVTTAADQLAWEALDSYLERFGRHGAATG